MNMFVLGYLCGLIFALIVYAIIFVVFLRGTIILDYQSVSMQLNGPLQKMYDSKWAIFRVTRKSRTESAGVWRWRNVLSNIDPKKVVKLVKEEKDAGK